MELPPSSGSPGAGAETPPPSTPSLPVPSVGRARTAQTFTRPSSPEFAARPVSDRPAVTHQTLAGGLRVPVNIGPLRPSGALGALMILSYSAVTGVLITLALHLTKAYGRIRDIRDGVRDVSAIDVTWAKAVDRQTASMAITAAALLVIGAITTSLWARRIAGNSRAVGVADMNVTACTVAWFIPIMHLFAGFSWLRRAPRADWPLVVWQVCFVAPQVAAWFVWRFFSASVAMDTALYGDVTVGTLFSSVRNEWILSLMFAAGFLLATLAALQAVVDFRTTFREIGEASAPPAR